MQGEQPPNQSPPNRLILPGSDDTPISPEQYTQRANTLPEVLPTSPMQLMNRGNAARPRLQTGSVPSMPRVSPPQLNRTDWRKDPAYKFLFIAIGVVLLASILFIAFAGSTLSSLFSQSSTGTTQTSPGGGAVQGTTDTNPQFPTPGGNVATTPTATSPSPVATTAPSPTPTTQPSPTPTTNPQLTIQIVNAPAQVDNNSTATINVTSDQPGVQVTLSITYNADPFFKTLGPQSSDSAGNTSFQWNVQVHPLGRTQVFAHLVATGRNQNGQQVSSQTVTVKIVLHGVVIGG